MLDRETRQLAEAKAAAHKWPGAHLCAAIDVESDGQVFATIGGKQLPVILFEPHILYRLTTGAVRDRLVAAKLASAKQNRKLYGRTQADRWKQLMAAREIAGPVAYEAASYGVGQVLGLHWKALGFASIDAFVTMMVSGAGGQIEIMCRYIETNGLDDELVAGRWAAFARGYNGPKYRQNAYDTRLEAAVAFYDPKAKPPAGDGMLRMGSRGARVRELQALLVRAGAPALEVDGDFGPATRDALKTFQQVQGLTVDGVYGPETERALAAFRQGEGDKPGAQKPVEVPGVVEGLGTAVGGTVTVEAAKQAVDAAGDRLAPFAGSSSIVDGIIVALTVLGAGLAVGGLAWAAWGWWKSRRTVEG